MSTTQTADLYRYNAKVTDVYDGDSFTCDIDLGFGVCLRGQKVRVARINTAEIRGGTAETKAAARVARDRVKLLILDQTVRLRTDKDKGKFGRWVAEVTTPDGDNLSDLLLDEGLAKIYGA